MPPKHQWVWKTYLLVMLIFVVKQAYGLVVPDEQSSFYYFILRAFDPFFYTIYIAHVMQILLSIVHWIPLFLFVHRIHFLPATFWKYLFILRCIFEITGHGFEMNSLTALYCRTPKIFWTVAVITIIPHIPSYAACYWYAFRQEKVLS